MADKSHEENQFRDYLTGLGRAANLPGAQNSERSQVEAEARRTAEAALLAERNAKDAVRDAERVLDDAAGRANRLVARAGAQVVEGAYSGRLPERLQEFSDATTSLLSDIQSAEKSWDWVERAQAQPAAPRPAPMAAPQMVQTQTPATSPAAGGSTGLNPRVLALIVLAILVLVGVIAVTVAL